MHKALIHAIKDTLSLTTIKRALATALPLALLWIAVGYLFWDQILGLTNAIISWIPFSIVKANGAFILIFFLWFIATLVSYALVVGLFSGFFLAQKQERRFETINFSLIFFIALGWALAMLYNWEWLDQKLQYLLTLLPFQTVSDTIAALLGVYLLYNAFLLTQYFIAYLLRANYLRAIAPSLKEEAIKIGATGRFFKDLVLFALLAVLAIPLLFIPVANFLILWFIWAWLYKESAFLGTCALVCDEESSLRLLDDRIQILAIALLGAFLNFIPIVSFFTPYFIFAFYLHYLLGRHDAEENLS